MNTKTILGISMAAAVAISLTSYATAAQGDGFDITNIMVGSDAAVIKTAQSVKGMPGAYGHAIQLDNGHILGVTTHGGAYDHVWQVNEKDPIFHIHELGGAPASSGECDDSGFPFYVNYEEDVDGNLSIDNNQIEITDIDMPANFEFPPSGLSFAIAVDSSNHVCFNPVDAFP